MRLSSLSQKAWVSFSGVLEVCRPQFGMNDDDLVKGYTPEEWEMKMTPRMFSLMTHPFRLYITATEKLTA
ncbi:unnamed protein product [Strongylus vulgaris]|uniref:RdRp catalytic domain-containing protein n=1 Tax=Strongylus vulgaris TaxID=40348 RepID=A0A3P7KB64_STRVU|nr:unnamed protein product [Strongylus vulgaris]